MIKKVSILASVVYLFLALVNPGLAQASSGLTILDSSHETEFPSRLSLNFSVESDANITDIRLCYAVDQTGFAQVISEAYIEFTPATAVETQWSWDMRRTGGLPPGSSVEYWWKVEDANGNRLETTPVRIHFDDTRYSWDSLTRDKVTIYWYEADESFAQELMSSALQALARLAEDTGARLKEPAHIYIYASAQDLQGAMVYPHEWTGGVAFTRYSTIAIGIAPYNLQWGKRAITHELTHLVIHQMTLNPYNDLPTWLDEGLAMYAEGELTLVFSTLLGKAITEDNLISVRSLSSPFSAYTEESTLSYAQSHSLVEFLISNYGQSKMLELLSVFGQGSNYDGALEKIYGFDMDGLDTRWRDYVTKQYQTTQQPQITEVTTTTAVYPAIIGILAGLATALLLVLGLAAESWAWKRGR